MKKLKLFPLALMLVLCIGVLGIGIYAASPATNTVQGKIEIVGSKYPVTIETWIEGLPEGENGYDIKENLRAGGEEFTFNNLKMDFSAANSLYDTHVVIAVKVTNLSNKELGAFFLNPENQTINEETGASRANLLPEDVITDQDGKELIDVYLTFYKQIGVKSDNADVITDEATLYIEFAPKDWVYDDYNSTLDNLLDFNYTLVIEEYKPNMTTEFVDYSNKLDFYKISTTYEDSEGVTQTRASAQHLGFGEDYSLMDQGIEFSGFGLTGGTYVVLPNTITSIGDGGDYDGSALGAFRNALGVHLVSLPNSLTTIGFGAFMGSGVKRIELPESVTTIGNISLCSGNLESVYVASENTKFYSQGNCIIETGTSASYGGAYKKVIVGGANVVLPSDITVIGEGAFRGSKNNLNLKVNCPNLKYIEQMSFGSFGSTGNNSNLELYIPAGCSANWIFLDFSNGNSISGKMIIFGGEFTGTFDLYKTTAAVFTYAEFLSTSAHDFGEGTTMGEVYNYILVNATTIYVPKNCEGVYGENFNEPEREKIVERT